MYQIGHEASNDLERYIILQQLAASNTLLYYYTIIHNLKSVAPIIYTPTVGEACQQFDRIYRCSSAALQLQRVSLITPVITSTCILSFDVVMLCNLPVNGYTYDTEAEMF